MRILLPCLVLFLPGLASAQLRVGPGETYTTIAAAAAAASDGDTVEIVAGTYNEEIVWTQNDLTIRGVSGRPVIDMTGRALTAQGGKGIFIIDGADVTLENLELVGASVPDENGAGVRWQGGGMLTVRHCVFRDNENGILGGNHGDNVALIEENEFVGNGRGDVGYTHQIYISEIDTLTFRGNWSHSMASGLGDSGHLVKTRARHNFILYNRLTAEDGPASYELQLPEGGTGYVIGNLIEQSPTTNNSNVISIGGDGMQWPEQRVFIVNNTIVNRLDRGTFIDAQAAVALDIVNNLFIGTGTMVSGGTVMRMEGNLMEASDASLVDGAGYDWHLAAGSAALNAGVDPGSDGAMSLVPAFEYAHPMMVVTRTSIGMIDVGAYELGNPGTGGDGGVGADGGGAGTDGGSSGADGGGARTDGGGPGADGGGSTGSGGGCGCTVGAGRPPLAVLALGVLLLAGAMRRRR